MYYAKYLVRMVFLGILLENIRFKDGEDWNKKIKLNI
jgi:hypothetical protein